MTEAPYWKLMVCAGAAMLAVSRTASAEDHRSAAKACIDASLQAQKLRAKGQWTAARNALATCSAVECPSVIRRDCVTWMSEVNAAMPTVVLGAQDAAGRDIVELTAFVDDVDVTAQAKGSAIPVDPGPHRIRYVLPDGRHVEQEFIVREGDKSRSLLLQFPEAPPSVVVARPPPAPPAPPSPPRSISLDRADITAAAVGYAVTLGTGILGSYYLAHEISETHQLSAYCAGGVCAPGTAANATLASNVSTINEHRAIAGASLGVSAASLGVATYFLIARPLAREGSAPPSTGASEGRTSSLSLPIVDVSFLRGGGALRVEGVF